MSLRFLRGLVSGGPPAFSFTPVTNATVSTLETSNTVTLGSFAGSVAISVTGGQYSKNSAAYTSSAGTAVTGDTISLQQTSSGSNSTETDTVFTAGTTSATWRVTTQSSAGVPLIAPGASFNGTPLSGYAGTLPDNVSNNPTRTTGKPAIRMTSAWGQRISGSTFRVIVDSEAGGLISGSDFGVSSVTCYVEGGTGTNTENVYIDTDINGIARRTIGYAFDIDVTACLAVSTTGGIDLYFKSTPKDATMQARVIGPYRFYPRSTPFSGTYNIGSGQTYSQLKAAVDAAVANSEEAPNFLFKTTGSYLMEETVPTYTGGKGFWVVSADAGVTATLARAALPTGDTSTWAWSPGPDGMEFRGSGVVLDYRNIGYINNTNATLSDGLKHGHRHNGSTVANSEGTLNSYYWAGMPRPQGLWTSAGFCEDTNIHEIPSALGSNTVARNNHVSSSFYEILPNCPYAAYNYFKKWDQSFFFTDEIAITIKYTGAGTGEVEVVGSLGTAGRVLNLRVNNATVFSLTLGYNFNDTYTTWAAVISAINTFGSGWTAAQDGASASQRSPSACGYFYPGNGSLDTTVDATFTLPGTGDGFDGVGASQIIIYNTGANTLFYALNANATTGSSSIAAGASAIVNIAGTYFTAVTASGTTTFKYNAVVGSTPMKLAAYFDFHQDAIHTISYTDAENVIQRGNVVTGDAYKPGDGSIMTTALRIDTATRDWMILDNCFYLAQAGGNGVVSQSHFVLRGTSWAKEGITQAGAWDAYSQFSDNIQSLFWQGAPFSNPAWINNYVPYQTAATGTSAALTNSPSTGNTAVSCVDYAAQRAANMATLTAPGTGDFRPTGPALSTLLARKGTYDGRGYARSATDAPGAWSKNAPATAWRV